MGYLSIVPLEDVLRVVAHGPKAWKIKAIRVWREDDPSALIPRIRGIHEVTLEECKDHFKKGLPKVLPGAATMELICQLGTYPLLLRFPGHIPLLGNFSGKPLVPILPGDNLDLQTEILELKGKKGKAKGEAYILGNILDTQKAYEVEFEFRIVRPAVLLRGRGVGAESLQEV